VDEDTKVLIGIRVARAREELEAVGRLIGLGHYRIAVSRAYYAIFGITTAVLLTHDIVRSKHSGIQSAFIREFIKTGHIEAQFGKLFTLLRKDREESDYSDYAKFSEEYAKARLADARRFVARMETYLRQVGAIEWSRSTPSTPGWVVKRANRIDRFAFHRFCRHALSVIHLWCGRKCASTNGKPPCTPGTMCDLAYFFNTVAKAACRLPIIEV